MPVSRELFLAVLSMDAYNRGYDESVGTLSNSQGARLGKAVILSDADDRQGVSRASGFYALAYDMSAVSGFGIGERVIAYRGTDDVNPLSSGQDLTTGWLVGGGAQWGQAPLAIA